MVCEEYFWHSSQNWLECQYSIFTAHPDTFQSSGAEVVVRQMQQIQAEKAPRRYQKSDARIRQILAEAKLIVSEEGYNSLTFSNLANRLGIRRFNVQYYFPSIDSLIQELIGKAAAEQSLRHLEIDKDLPAEEKVNAYFSHIISNVSDTLERSFYLQLHALSASNGQVAAYVDKLYELFTSDLVATLRLINPKLTLAERKKKATIIICLVDGMGMVLDQKLSQRKYKAVRDEAINTILKIIF